MNNRSFVEDWCATHRVDITNILQRISDNAPILAQHLKDFTIDIENDSNFNQKLFLTLLDFVENKFPSKSSPETVPRPYRGRARLPVSSAIPLKKFKRYVLKKDVVSALELHASKGLRDFSYIDPAQVVELTALVNSARDRILLDEKQLALLVQLVFSSAPHVTSHAAGNDENKQSEPEEQEFEREVGNEKAQAIINSNKWIPQEVIDLSIQIFGEQRAAALMNLFICWIKDSIYELPAITNLILFMPVAKLATTFSVSLIDFGMIYFTHYYLEIELAMIYEMVKTLNEEDLKKFIKILSWPLEHRIQSVSNALSILACKDFKDFIDHFPMIKIAFNAGIFDYYTVLNRNQIIFDLIIHHMQSLENLYNIQNQYSSQLLNDANTVSTNLGSDVSNLICEYNDTLETQGFFAQKCLRQMPTEKHLDIQDLFNEFKLK